MASVRRTTVVTWPAVLLDGRVLDIGASNTEMDRFLTKKSSQAAASSNGINLDRFISKQREDHDHALRELTNGHKSSCWSWWIFPTPPFIKNGQRVKSIALVFQSSTLTPDP